MWREEDKGGHGVGRLYTIRRTVEGQPRVVRQRQRAHGGKPKCGLNPSFKGWLNVPVGATCTV